MRAHLDLGNTHLNIAKADAEESPYQYCSGDPVGGIDPSGLFVDFTHNWTTYKACHALGIAPKWAAVIAWFAEEIDRNSVWKSWAPRGYGCHLNATVDSRYRERLGIGPWNAVFEEMPRDSRRANANMFATWAVRAWDSGDKHAACRWLGYGAHCLEDVYAHGNMVQHVTWGFECDDWRWVSPYEMRIGAGGGYRWGKAYSSARRYLSRFKRIKGLKTQ